MANDVARPAVLLALMALTTPTMAATSTTYPPAHTVDQVDDYFGTKVPDPYRWMEDVDSPDVKAWVDAENMLTAAHLDAVPGRDVMRTRLLALTDYERFGLPHEAGGRYFFSHNTGLQNQSVLYWQQGLDGERKVLIDPNTLSADGTLALGATDPTLDGKLIAYTTQDAGSDWQTWHVRDVASGQDLPDVIHWAKFSGAGWAHDGSGFYYSAYDAPKAGTFKSVNKFQKVYFHKLGTPQADDKLVYERPDDPEMYLNGWASDDGRWLFLMASKGDNNALSVRDLSHPEAPPIVVASVMDAKYHPVDTDGTTMWMRTTKGSPNGKVVAVDLSNPAPAHWKTVVPEGRNRIDGVSLVNDKLIVQVLADARSQVDVYDRDGKPLGRVELPGVGSAGGFGGKRTDTETFFSFTNVQTPGTIYRLDLKTMAATVYRQPKLAFDPSEFETAQVFYPSKDGTKIPMTISYRKGLKRDGNNPTLLYGYGGFDISLLPGFSAKLVLWMEMGGVYAQPNLRGGGEYGDAWHWAGAKLKKQNVFDDFIAAAEYLRDQKYTRPAKLAINGGSNGGLLVGAVELQRPDLFGAAVAQVGVMDMLRFDKFTVGFGWRDDYGSPSANEADFRSNYKFSPVHNVKPGVKYPPTLITTADHDDRVFPAHSFKFAAALQAEDGARAAADGSPLSPILIRVETRAGHGAGMPLAKQVDLTVDVYSFLKRELKID
jgi:prolyl oligopeptidase